MKDEARKGKEKQIEVRASKKLFCVPADGNHIDLRYPKTSRICDFTSTIKHCQRAQRTQVIEFITRVNFSARIVTCIGSKVVHQIESLALPIDVDCPFGFISWR